MPPEIQNCHCLIVKRQWDNLEQGLTNDVFWFMLKLSIVQLQSRRQRLRSASRGSEGSVQMGSGGHLWEHPYSLLMVENRTLLLP